MGSPSDSKVQNLLPVQAYFDAQNNFVTFIGQNKPFYAIPDPYQSGLHITNSTIDSTTIGATTPSTGVFTNIATTTGTISTQPSGATDIVNLLALQSYAAGISWKQPCAVATLLPITLSGLQTIDTYSVQAGDRVLVKNQGTASQNGIYLASAGGWTRALDADTWSELICAISFIEYGTQKGSAWFCTAQAGGTIDVTAVNWSQFTTSATYTAGTGLTLTGFEFSITPVGTAGTYGSASSVPVFVTNASGQVSSVTNTSIAIGATQITSGTIDSARLSGSYSGITGLGTLTNLTVTNPISGSITGNAATATSAGSATTSTNLAGGTTGSLPYQSNVATTTMLGIGTNGQILTVSGGAPSWQNAPATGVTSFGGGTTGLTPASATTGAITLGGTLAVANGGTGATTASGARSNLGAAASGANSDITGLTGLTNGISSPTFIQFNTSPTVTRATGRLWWDNSDGIQTLNLGMAGTNATLQIGEEMYYRIKCSSAITEGQVVMFSGTVGASGALTGAPATGLTADTAAYVMGVATESGATNDWIYVTNFGLVRGINATGGAEAWVNGQILYYDPAVAGGLTKNLPSAPNAKVQVAAVVYADAANGSLFIRPTFGGSLGQYEGDVQITTPANGQLLIRNQTAGKWVNATLTAGTGISITNGAGSVTVASSGITITDDTTSATTFYPTFTSATSGSITGETVSSTKLQYVPSTGALTATKYYGDGSALTGIISGATISNDTSTASNLYPLFSSATSGTPTTIYTSNAKYLYKPSTGDLQASQLVASNGIVVNSQTVATSYTIPTGSSAMSSGPVTVNSGVTVTISSGSRWVVL